MFTVLMAALRPFQAECDRQDLVYALRQDLLAKQ